MLRTSMHTKTCEVLQLNCLMKCIQSIKHVVLSHFMASTVCASNHCADSAIYWTLDHYLMMTGALKMTDMKTKDCQNCKKWNCRTWNCKTWQV